MPVITSGQTGTFTLDAFGYIDVVSAGDGTLSGVSLAPPLKSNVSVSKLASTRYGPYGVPIDWTITCTNGTITYTVTAGVGGSGSGAYLGTVADEAAMIALSSAAAGDECYRTDTASFWKLRVAPYSSAANWTDLGATSAADVAITDAGSYYTGAEVETALQEIGADLAANLPTTGNLPQFGAIRALTDWNKYSVTADAIVISGPCIVKGFRCLTGTAIAGVYDALSATGTNLMPSVTTAANTEYLLAGEGGVLFSTGLYVDWGSGTYVFYALPVEP
jgi:hypothetical protein